MSSPLWFLKEFGSFTCKEVAMVTLPGGKLNISMSLIHIINTHRMIQSLALLSSSARGGQSWNYARTSPAPGRFGAHMSEVVRAFCPLGSSFPLFLHTLR